MSNVIESQFPDRRWKHGGTNSPEYGCWKNMKQRCYDSNSKDYPEYGGRGIKVCKRWKDSFSNFLADMGPRPSSRHSIDRLDGSKDYSPENCRWATPRQQANNTKRNVRITHNGMTLTVAQWSRRLGIPAGRIHERLGYGWSSDKILSTEEFDRKEVYLTYQGETLNLTEWAKRLGVQSQLLGVRVRRGWSVERVLDTAKWMGNNTFITHQGETLNIKQWSLKLGIPYATIKSRIRRKLSVEDILHVGKHPSRKNLP